MHLIYLQKLLLISRIVGLWSVTVFAIISHLITWLFGLHLFCGAESFAEVSKILKIWLDTGLKIILLDYQNNYLKYLSVNDNAAKSFNILAISLSVLHNYFDLNEIIFRSVAS